MRFSVALSTLSLLVLVQSEAFAYCRTTTCAQKDPPAECLPGTFVGSCQMAGLPLAWPSPCVSYSVNLNGSKTQQITADDLEARLRVAYDNWQNVTCASAAGAKPNISVVTFEQVECSEVRYNKASANQNVWMFRDDVWPHDDPANATIALTSVLFNPKTGDIYDVDVELNSAHFNFNPALNLPALAQLSTADLQSVIQHESGHFLGLAHSDVMDSTMYASYAGSSEMSSLEADDAAGLCATYPPAVTATVAGTCDATPRHGFATDCEGGGDDSGICSIARVKGARSPLALGLLIALGTAGLRRRRNLPS